MQSSWFESPKSLFNSTRNYRVSSTIFRQATLDDVEGIAEVLTLGFNNFNDLTFWLYPLIKIGVCQDLRKRLQNDEQKNICLIAINIIQRGNKVEQEVLGTVELSFRERYHWQKKEKYAYIANLAVSENHRRQGIASELLFRCQQIAQEKNYGHLYLHVLASNHDAQQLYINNGYTIQEVETDLFSLFVPSQRRLLMTKSL